MDACVEAICNLMSSFVNAPRSGRAINGCEKYRVHGANYRVPSELAHVEKSSPTNCRGPARRPVLWVAGRVSTQTSEISEQDEATAYCARNFRLLTDGVRQPPFHAPTHQGVGEAPC